MLLTLLNDPLSRLAQTREADEVKVVHVCVDSEVKPSKLSKTASIPAPHPYLAPRQDQHKQIMANIFLRNLKVASIQLFKLSH